MENKSKKLYLLTGFLGAGKTTFLKSVIDSLSDQKVGIIMNEFGKTGIDGTLVKKDGITLTEIDRGSIFCSCLKISFVQAMVEMSNQDIDYLFVESSGLADPSNIDEIMDAVRRLAGDDAYDYRGAICIVDGRNFLEQLDELETIKRQALYSNLVVINKSDLIDQPTIESITKRVKEINPYVDIHPTSFGKIDRSFLEKDLVKEKWIESQDTTNTTENKPRTFTLRYKGDIPKENLTKFLDAVSPSTFRIKGFSKLDEGWNQVDVVNSKIDYKEFESEAPDSSIVFISKIGIGIIKEIADNWENIVGVEMKLR
ncbi:GTPase, G3E family [Peptoclostridium litorale DSM 5388]|uniref:CobW/P47K family protein n=1 Tax=Peptoclostridium litorale DSM 5388 TaxID=1121324 RepID=A0A069R9S3_PEPLI|nr:GTP-binding protein [Peptoclostridium litorale]KDR93786.1 CobW/P47K family protein [Peptoclostridium litorale DSM 5388]SIN85834.1 GTPase, G3E family [Peptoclostridium litorale DSM 5388]